MFFFQTFDLMSHATQFESGIDLMEMNTQATFYEN